MTRDELEAIRKRDAMIFEPDPQWRTPAYFITTADQDRVALLAYVDQLLAVVAAADKWLAKDDEVEDDPSTVGSREAYRTARKTLK